METTLSLYGRNLGPSKIENQEERSHRRIAKAIQYRCEDLLQYESTPNDPFRHHSCIHNLYHLSRRRKIETGGIRTAIQSEPNCEIPPLQGEKMNGWKCEPPVQGWEPDTKPSPPKGKPMLQYYNSWLTGDRWNANRVLDRHYYSIKQAKRVNQCCSHLAHGIPAIQAARYSKTTLGERLSVWLLYVEWILIASNLSLAFSENCMHYVVLPWPKHYYHFRFAIPFIISYSNQHAGAV